jgi:transposase-like protein
MATCDSPHFGPGQGHDLCRNHLQTCDILVAKGVRRMLACELIEPTSGGRAMTDIKRFICPDCTAVLNEQDPKSIRMAGTLLGPGFSITIEFGLSAVLGEYGASFDPMLTMEEGCRVRFACPHCGRDFTTTYNGDLAEIEMIDGQDEYMVVFSRIFGEQSSFVLELGSKKLVASYGEDAASYVAEFGKGMNFFGS